MSVPREERVHRPGVGGRRMDRGLVTSLHVGGFGSGRQDPDVTGQVQWRVRTRSPRNLPADQGQETGTGLTGWLRAGPEPDSRSSALSTKLRISPDTLTSSPCCYGPADSLSRSGLAGPSREIPFLSLGLTGIPLNFGIHAVQSSARKSSRNDEFSSGLAAFWFLWPGGGSVAPQCRRSGFSCALAL